MTWFTAEHGKLKTVAKGALRPKSRFAGTLDLFYACEIAVARSARSELHTLREAVLQDARDHLRLDYNRVSLAAYFVELLDLATVSDHPDPALFDLMSRALTYLDGNPATRRALLHFESELARILGILQPGTTAIMAIGRACHQIPSARSGLLDLLRG